jgi:thiamine pyrophosphate-dependent acetolactate synthase large subunit-like protein
MSTMEGLDALRLLSEARADQIAVLSESCRQDWPPLSTRPDLDISITGSMGKASSFGLGLALSQPSRGVWVLDTDGALLMNLGSLVTIARMKPANLLHFVYDNDAYDTTGGQPTPGSHMVNFQAIALDAGYPRAFLFDRLEDFSSNLSEVLAAPKPALCVLKVASHGRRASAGQMKRMYDSFVEIRSQFS